MEQSYNSQFKDKQAHNQELIDLYEKLEEAKQNLKKSYQYQNMDLLDEVSNQDLSNLLANNQINSEIN